MSRKTVTILKCDICGKEVKTDSELKKVSVPMKKYSTDKTCFSKEFDTVDMCLDCKNNFWNNSTDGFAEISNFGGEITVDKRYY